jgi:molybdopterin-guanine dinucleotide biosynthesis protein A
MPDRSAGIVLAGGRSRRMGTPKASLEWHGSTLLRRAVGIVGRAVDGPVIVVRARDQELPALPAGVEIAADARPGRGPLQGIAAGLQAIGDRAQVVFVTGVDLPLLHPALVRHVLRSLRPADDVALPRAHGFAQPLAAAYRVAIAPRLHELIAQERLGTGELFEGLRVRVLDAEALLADAAVATHDPGLDSLLNVNEPGEYAAARARPAPGITISAPGEATPRTVRAATLAAAAAAAGVACGDATIEGHGPIADPSEPLVAGDALNFRAASS